MPSNEWNCFVYLYHCGVTGAVPVAPAQKPDLELLLSIADRQAATGVIACALRQNASDYLPAEAALRLRAEAASKNLHTRQRMEAALEVIEKLQAAGIRAVVLKGMSEGVLYRYPESRSSSDTDVLVPPEQEDAALALLSDWGFAVEQRGEGQHHSECRHPQAGLFELHVRLFNDEFSRVLYRADGADLTLTLASETLWGRRFSVLTPDQNLLFLSLHLLKHFAHQWTAFRVFYDFALYFARHQSEIDAPAFWAELRRLGAEDFFHTVLSMLVRAGCFDASDFPGMVLQPAESCDRLAEDIAQYDRGKDAFSRQLPVWLTYYNRQSQRLVGEDHRRWSRAYCKGLLFPPVKDLALTYPILERHAWLYPVCWTRRIVRGMTDRDHRLSLALLRVLAVKRGAPKADRPEMARLTLLRDMHLLD